MPADRMLAALNELPSFNEPLKKAIPFLMPLGGPNDTHVTLPPEKENRKIRFQEEILVTEIENRFFLNDFPEDDDEGSYEIEIVEDDGDADFYLEIVDGEVFYVFETEDDISLEEDEFEMELDHDNQQAKDGLTDQLNSSMFNINLEDMMAPDLEESEHNKKESPEGPPMEIACMMESFNQSGHFGDGDLENLMEPSEEDQSEKVDATPSNPLDDIMEEEPEPPRSKNHRLVSEETLVLMEEEPAKPSASVIVNDNKPLSADPKPAGQATTTTTSWEKNINTESTTARLVQQPQQSDDPSASQTTGLSAGEPSASGYSSPTPGSPSRTTKSILRCNMPSPVKKPKKATRPKEKKATKTVSKTYVRADQLDGEHRVYSWAKPDWTTKNTQLRRTGRAEKLREGKLEAPITFFPKKPVNEGLKEVEVDTEAMIRKAMNAKSVSFFGHKKNLKVSLNGSKLREGQDIVKPITKATVRVESAHLNKVANPGVLKSTATGDQVRKGATLAAPVTFPKIKLDHTNRVANKNVLKNKGVETATKKQYEWSKPDWMKKPQLRMTAIGEAVKQGADLQGPITQAPHTRRKSFDGNDFSSSGSLSSDAGRSDEAVVPPRRGRRAPPRATSLPSSNISQISAISDEDSTDCCDVNSYDGERLKKENELSERQQRLARMAQRWQNEDP